jgi:hypothetical protein
MIGENHREDGATLVIPTENGVSAHAVDMWVHTALRGLPPPARLSAALVTHELLARAKNARSAPYVVRLILVDRHRTLAVAVDDCAAGATGPQPDPNLVMVAGLSARWGVEQRRSGRTTWAELIVDAHQPLPGPGRMP